MTVIQVFLDHSLNFLVARVLRLVENLLWATEEL